MLSRKSSEKSRMLPKVNVICDIVLRPARSPVTTENVARNVMIKMMHTCATKQTSSNLQPEKSKSTLHGCVHCCVCLLSDSHLSRSIRTFQLRAAVLPSSSGIKDSQSHVFKPQSSLRSPANITSTPNPSDVHTPAHTHTHMHACQYDSIQIMSQ